jgi:hypothetical protein
MRLPRLAAHALLICVALVQPASAASDRTLEKGFADALRYDGKGQRQARAGKAIRAYQAAGVLPRRPQRQDYTDYYVVKQPTAFMGNPLVLMVEEYMAAYVGCCVNPGAGAYVRVTGSIEPMRDFAGANRCRIEEYADRKALLAVLPAGIAMPPGKYAALLCQESDEDEAAAAS